LFIKHFGENAAYGIWFEVFMRFSLRQTCSSPGTTVKIRTVYPREPCYTHYTVIVLLKVYYNSKNIRLKWIQLARDEFQQRCLVDTVSKILDRLGQVTWKTGRL